MVVADALRRAATPPAPGVTCTGIIAPAALEQLAERLGRTLRELEIMALKQGIVVWSTIYGPADEVPRTGVETALGNPAATPAMVAAWQVQETVKILTGCGTLLCNRLLYMDAEYGHVEIFTLS